VIFTERFEIKSGPKGNKNYPIRVVRYEGLGYRPDRPKHGSN